MTTGIAAALVAAQAEFTNPKKSSKANVGTYSYAYADLPTILDHIRPVLAAHGLAVTQNVAMDGGRVEVYTTVHHASGEFLTFGPIVGSSGGDMRALGSAITYMRRYSLTAALGIAGEEDTDGEGAPKLERVSHSDQHIDAQDPWQTSPITADGMDDGRALPVSESTPDRSLLHTPGATEKQIGTAKRLVTAWAKQLDRTPVELLSAWLEDHGYPAVSSFDELGKAAASALIGELMGSKS